MDNVNDQMFLDLEYLPLEEVIEKYSQVEKHQAGKHDQKKHAHGVKEFVVGRVAGVQQAIQNQIAYFKTPDCKKKLKIAAIAGGTILGAAAVGALAHDTKVGIDSLKLMGTINTDPAHGLGSKKVSKPFGKSSIHGDTPEEVAAIEAKLAGMSPDYKDWVANSGVELHGIRGDGTALYGFAHPAQPGKVGINLKPKGTFMGALFGEVQGIKPGTKPDDVVRATIAHEVAHNHFLNTLSDDDRINIQRNQNEGQRNQLNASYGMIPVMRAQANNMFGDAKRKLNEELDMTVANEGFGFMTSDHYTSGSDTAKLRKKYGEQAAEAWSSGMTKSGYRAPEAKSITENVIKTPYNLYIDEKTGARFYL